MALFLTSGLGLFSLFSLGGGFCHRKLEFKSPHWPHGDPNPFYTVESRDQKGKVTSPRSQSWKVAEPTLKLKASLYLQTRIKEILYLPVLEFSSVGGRQLLDEFPRRQMRREVGMWSSI